MTGCRMTAVAVNIVSATTTVPATWAIVRGSRGAIGHHHEEGDAEPGSEQDGCAEDMRETKQFLHAHRSSRMASATSASTTAGTTLTSGPSGSAQRPGISTVAAPR